MKSTRLAAVLCGISSSLFFVANAPVDLHAAASSSSPTASTVAPPPSDSPEATVEYVVEGLLQHEPQRVWASLPESYQRDVNKLVSAFSAKVDADIYDRGFVLVGRFGELLETKKELLLASQMLPEDFDREEAAANWDAFTGAVRTLANSDIARVETLSTLNIEKFLSTTGKTLLAQAEQAASAAGEDVFADLRDLKFEVTETGEDSATLRWIGAEATGEDDTEAKGSYAYVRPTAEEVELVRVEGRWIPRELAEGWSESMAETLAQVEAMSPKDLQQMKPQILGMYGMIEGTLGQLEAAQTAQQLDAALQGAMFTVMGMFMGPALQGMDGGMEVE